MSAPEDALAAGDEFRMFAAGDIRDVLAETTDLSVGDRNRVAWQIVDALAEWVAGEKAQAWDEGWCEGWCAGASNVFAAAGKKPMPQGNSYRLGGQCDHGYPPVSPDGTCPSCGLTRNPHRKDQEADAAARYLDRLERSSPSPEVQTVIDRLRKEVSDG